MVWWLLPALMVARFIVGRLMAPKIAKAKVDGLTFPSIDEGTFIPVVFGTAELAPIIVWWGDVAANTGNDGFTAYYARMHAICCQGPVDELIDVAFDKKSIRGANMRYWNGTYAGGPWSPTLPRLRGSDDNTHMHAAALDLFGGEEKEGGIAGAVEFFWGTQGHDQSVLLANKYGFNVRYPGWCGLTFGVDPSVDQGISGATQTNFHWGNNTPVPKVPTIIIRRTPNATALGQTATQANIGGGANPIEVLYELFTNQDYGLGISDSLLNLTNLQTVAGILRDEGFGISVVLADPTEVGDLIDDVLSVIDGVLRLNPLTGKFEIKLARADYTVSDLLSLTVSNFELTKFSRGSWRETVNEVRVKYRRFGADPGATTTTQTLTTNLSFRPYTQGEAWFKTKGKDITVTSCTFNGTPGANGVDFIVDGPGGLIRVKNTALTDTGQTVVVIYVSNSGFTGFRDAVVLAQNLANFDTTGELRPQIMDMPMVTDATIAGIVAQRSLRAFSLPLAKGSGTMHRVGYSLGVGDVVNLTWAPLGVVDLPVRLTKVDYGSADENLMAVDFIEDVFGSALASYVAPPVSGWAEPTTDNTAAPDVFTTEITWGSAFAP